MRERRTGRQRQKSREEERRLTITVEEWEAGRPAGKRRKEDKAREDLLQADNEGVIRSEIAYRRSTNSGPHARPFLLYCVKWYACTHTMGMEENGI